jgi:hypothetical protein
MRLSIVMQLDAGRSIWYRAATHRAKEPIGYVQPNSIIASAEIAAPACLANTINWTNFPIGKQLTQQIGGQNGAFGKDCCLMIART